MGLLERKLLKLTESQESVTADGRLERPWTVLLFGLLAPIALIVMLVLHSRSGQQPLDDKMLIGFVGIAVLTFVLSAAYAYLGWRYSRKLARRVVGIIGGVAILSGVGVLAYAILSYAP
jgi:hypothetical protein